MGFEGQASIRVNAQMFYRFGWGYGSISHFHTSIPTAQEMHKLSLSNVNSEFFFPSTTVNAQLYPNVSK